MRRRRRRQGDGEEGMGAMSSVCVCVCVCVCGIQSAVSSVLCRFMQERGFMLTCNCHCCHSYAVSGFNWKLVFVVCFNMVLSLQTVVYFNIVKKGVESLLLPWQQLFSISALVYGLLHFVKPALQPQTNFARDRSSQHSFFFCLKVP